MRDRAMQALHLLALDPVAETTADHHSYGFRRGRSTVDAIEQVRNVLGRYTKSARWVLEGDIKGCFDNISHEWLLANVPMDKRVLGKWLRAGYIEMGKLFPTQAGTPQGGIISPVLANMALDGLQKELESRFKGRKAQSAKVNLVRYADDFIITGSSRELLEEEVKPLVVRFLTTRGLVLSETKTKITHVSEGFDFLGWNVRLMKRTLLTQPSKKNTMAFMQKIRARLREMRATSQKDVIASLSPVIRGWASYHRSQMATRTFSKCDHQIWQALWRWAYRRHPNKGKRWIKQRYFRSHKGRDWRFADKDKLLPILGEYGKRPHTKIKAAANPYDPKDDDYFSKRLGRKMKESLEGRRKLRWIWLWQGGTCPICEQRITQETGWHLHHVIKRSQGGSDQANNLVLLHPNCHMQYHATEE